MSKEARSIRLAQTLVPFGVGAIYDLRGESLIACDISMWRGNGRPIRSKRLADALKVDGFRSAPSQVSTFGNQHGPAVPYYRFPQWLFCQSCRTMTKWSIKKEVNGEPPTCATCRRRPQLVPMRFVLACSNGHVGDVPWEFWAHFGAKEPNQKQCRSRNLCFHATAGSGAGLESLSIECKSCGARRSLSGITTRETVRLMALKCPGKQPWQYTDGTPHCDCEPVVLQRGASNLYFAHTRSAIDIPPESLYDEFSELTLAVLNHPMYQTLKTDPDGPISAYLMSAIAEQLGCSADQVRAVTDRERRAIDGDNADAAGDLETDEWLAFVTRQPEQHEQSTFITRHVALLDDQDRQRSAASLLMLDGLIGKVVLATKLREVRALTGFNRYEISSNVVTPDLGKNLGWLPAIEVFGEGIFFTIREDRIAEWERREDVQRIATTLENRRQKHFIGSRLKPATPRFLLLHTLAHLLIRELSFQCGYSSSSLRERIYAGGSGDEPQAGILIYTAAGDVEGTLGGLVRQGESPRFAHTLLSALERAAWCSSDPICVESPGQGFGTLNLGACHACSLLSETSCENANVLLDRGLVIGVAGRVLGFFEDVIRVAAEDSAEEQSGDTGA